MKLRAITLSNVRRFAGRTPNKFEDIDWTLGDDVIELRIVVDNHSFLIFSDADVGVGRIDKTVRVRVEKVR